MKRMKANKGSFGYIKNRKIFYIMKVVLLFMIAVAIYLTGYFLNKKSNVNLFTIIAVLFVLPGAKALTEFILFFPYHSVSYERYKRVYETLVLNIQHPAKMTDVMSSTVVIENGCNLLSEVVFTSSEKVMNLDFLVITDHKIIGLLGNKKQDLSYVQTYIHDGVKGRKFDYDIKIVSEEDKFLSALKSVGIGLNQADLAKKSYQREREGLFDYLLSLVVK